MAITKAATRLAVMSEAPQQEDAFEDWIGMGSALNFLRADVQEDEFVVYASDYSSFIHAIAVPAALLNPPDIEDLVSWRTSPSSCWSVTARLSEPETFGSPTHLKMPKARLFSRVRSSCSHDDSRG